MQQLFLLFVVYFILFFIFPLLRNKPYLFYSILFILVLSWLSYYVLPGKSWDLYRHLETIELYKDVGLDWVIKNRMDLNLLTHLYLYLFTFVDGRLFPATTVFISYFIPILLIYKCAKRFELSQVSVFVITFFFISNLNYLLVVSNCRMYILYALFAYFLYMELIEKKYKIGAWIFYLAAPLFHYGILPLVGCRLVLLLRKKYIISDKVILVSLFLLSVGYIFILPYLGTTGMLSAIGSKVSGYQGYKVFGKWQYMNSMTCLIMIFIIAYLVYKQYKYHGEYGAFLFYIVCLSIFLAGQLSNYQLIYRSSNFYSMFAVVPFALMQSTSDVKVIKYREILGLGIVLQSVYSFIYNFVYVYNTVSFDF